MVITTHFILRYKVNFIYYKIVCICISVHLTTFLTYPTWQRTQKYLENRQFGYKYNRIGKFVDESRIYKLIFQ